jgi:hypothetical protein
MATDTRANRLAAADYIYIRLVIASMFVRNHICEPKSVVTQRFGCVKAIKKTLQRLIRLLYVDFAPRAWIWTNAYILSINLRAGRQEWENIRGGTQGAAKRECFARSGSIGDLRLGRSLGGLWALVRLETGACRRTVDFLWLVAVAVVRAHRASRCLCPPSASTWLGYVHAGSNAAHAHRP